MTYYRRSAIIDIFTKLGKKYFELWMSGVEKKGEFRAWHPNGKLAHQSLWKDGKLNGVALFWWPNGQLKTRSFYKNGKNMSIKYWDERGNLIK